MKYQLQIILFSSSKPTTALCFVSHIHCNWTLRFNSELIHNRKTYRYLISILTVKERHLYRMYFSLLYFLHRNLSENGKKYQSNNNCTIVVVKHLQNMTNTDIKSRFYILHLEVAHGKKPQFE